MPKGYYGDRNWTGAQLLTLEEGLALGWTDERIARAIGRSVTSVQLARKRRGWRKPRLSAQAVAETMGKPCSKPVTKWIQRGWLTACKGERVGPSRKWVILQEDLIAFLENPEYWPAWKPERITLPWLREWALSIRQERWLSTGGVAKRLHVGHSAVHAWIQRGLLPAKRWGNWWVSESALAGFEPPCNRSKAGLTVRRFSKAERVHVHSRRGHGAKWQDIAADLNRSISSVFGAYQRSMA
jgi:hypothetical protein